MLDTELDGLLAAVRAFKTKAARATRRVHARAEGISDAIAATREERVLQLVAADVQADPAEDALLDALAELPSASPDDSIGGALDHLVEYRSTLRSLAAAAESMTAARPA